MKLMWLSEISFITVFIIYAALSDIVNGKCIPIIPTMVQIQNAMVYFLLKDDHLISFYWYFSDISFPTCLLLSQQSCCGIFSGSGDCQL